MINLLAEILSILKKIKPTYLVIIILISIIFFQRACSEPKIVVEKVIDTITKIKIDTITRLDTVYIPKYSYKLRVDTITKYDTVRIIEEYFTKVYYQDTILKDSNAFIVVMDTLYQNEIISRSVYSQIYPRTIYKTSYRIIDPKFKLKVGFGVGGWDDKFGASLKVLAVTKRDKTYGASYDFINNFAEVSLYWTIRFKKR